MNDIRAAQENSETIHEGDGRYAERPASTWMTLITVALASAAAALSLAELILDVPVWNSWSGRLAVLAALAAAGYADLSTKHVPRAVSYPLLVGGAGSLMASVNVPALILLAVVLLDLRLRPRIVETVVHVALLSLSLYLGFSNGNPTFIVPVVTTLMAYRMWRANWLGGGDGQLLIALTAIYPDPRLLIATAGGWFVVGFFWIARTYRTQLLTALTASVQAPTRPVSRLELEESGVPMTLGITVGWAAYACIMAAPVILRTIR